MIADLVKRVPEAWPRNALSARKAPEVVRRDVCAVLAHSEKSHWKVRFMLAW